MSIGPTKARTDDDLVAVIDTPATDDKSALLDYAYTWKQDGLPRPDLDTDTVPAAETAKGELWELSVTANDGEQNGNPGRAETTILNTAPTVTVAIAPMAPLTTEDLVAVPTATDADGDPVTFIFIWTADDAATSTVIDTIAADVTEHGQVWSVPVTPSDEEAGEPATASVTIENTAPEVLSVAFVPDSPFVTDDVVAVVEGYDADGDPIAYDYRCEGDPIQWTVDDDGFGQAGITVGGTSSDGTRTTRRGVQGGDS